MKFKDITSFLRPQGETLAVFGGARLVKHLDGKFELHGGSPDDHAAAREWCSHFLQNVPASLFRNG